MGKVIAAALGTAFALGAFIGASITFAVFMIGALVVATVRHRERERREVEAARKAVEQAETDLKFNEITRGWDA